MYTCVSALFVNLYNIVVPSHDQESRTNAIDDSKIRAATEPRITVTDESASKTAAPGIKAIEEAKVPPTNGNNIRAFQDPKP